MKRIIGYKFGNINKSRYVEDVQHVTLMVWEFEVVDPAQELLQAAHYSDHSLENVQRKVKRIRELGAKNWLDTPFNGARVDFEFQGSVKDGNWYASCVEHMQFTAENSLLLSKICKHCANGQGYGSFVPTTLLSALHKLKAVEVDIDKDGGNIFYVRQEPSSQSAQLVTANC